jgi:phage regulator Rha-like protein
MSNLSVLERNGALVVDSRLIAKELGIEHRALLQTLDKYLDKIQGFGVVTFEMSKPPEGSKGGRPERVAYLTEDQATLLMTFSRNTERVVECKVALVRAFSEAKRVIKEAIPAQAEQLLVTPTSPARLTMLKEAVAIGNQLGGFDDRQKMLLKDQLMNLLMQERLLAADSTPTIEAAIAAEPEQPKRLEVPISDRCLDLGYNPNTKQLLKIGQVAAAFYRGRHGRPPQKREQFVGGTTRLVNVYTADDLGILDSAIQSVMGD